MRTIKEYTIKLNENVSNFYEDFSKVIKCPVENVLEDILKKNIEAMMKFLEVSD